MRCAVYYLGHGYMYERYITDEQVQRLQTSGSPPLKNLASFTAKLRFKL